MKTEKVIISFIAVLIGILASGVAFFLYQSTKVIPKSDSKTAKAVTISPKSLFPSPQPTIFLTIDSPKDEAVVENRTISISGKTTPDATVLISTTVQDQVINPAKNGDFSTTIILENGQNSIECSAISPKGEEAKEIRTVTVSSETF